MGEVDLSVIIVSWNVASLVTACLESVFLAARALTIEVIVVDNNSTDNTVEQVQTRFPQVQLIINHYNVGFAAANNQALAISRGRYILLLNPDTIVVEDSLVRMVNYAETHSDVGLLGPMLETPNGQIQYYCARSFPTPIDWFWYYSFIGQLFSGSRFFGRLYLSYWDHKCSRPVECLAGAAMLMPRQILQEVGFLDVEHPMYFEDIDYCYRVRMTGKQIYYLAEARVIHYGGQSSLQVADEATILILEAHTLFLRRYGRQLDALLFRLVVIAAESIRLPVLSGLKLWFTTLGTSKSAKVARIRPRSELISLVWGLGLVKSPKMEDMKN